MTLGKLFIFSQNICKHYNFFLLEKTSFPIGIMAEPGCINNNLIFYVAYSGLVFIHSLYHIVLTIELNGIVLSVPEHTSTKRDYCN